MTVTIIPIHNHRWKLLICVDKLLVIPLQVQFYVFYNFFNENVIIFNHIDIYSKEIATPYGASWHF